MKYISAFRNSIFYHRLLNIITALMLLPPLAVFFVFWKLMKENGAGWSDLPSSILLLILMTFLIALFSALLVRFIFKRQLSLAVEINDDGIHHLLRENPAGSPGVKSITLELSNPAGTRASSNSSPKKVDITSIPISSPMTPPLPD